MDNCLVCERIKSIENGTNKNFICELNASYVVLGDSQYYKGYTLLLSKMHCTELHDLENGIRKTYLNEMATVAEAVFKVFEPKKMNYELLGNKHAHLHWHIFPRYLNDPSPLKPVWIIKDEIRNNILLNNADRAKIIEQLKSEIFKLQ
jgi:diadenosine tetraphosphate (Ap4A) HIT family hydrolase